MNKSHNWIPQALSNPRMTVAVACSVPYIIEQDKLDERLSTRVMSIADTKIKPEEN